ncbi:LamG domain-containing protein [Microcoleus sp. MOSTC5]|uniref:LamG-like jellyroll fold domain-containing protein n=1 Tax=Microcoleus sp. MOSTC5 TaxID=3055378 RepID=UPI002FD30C6D
MTTFLPQEKLQNLNSIAHEGKIVVFATDTDGNISYTVKQDGFEDSYLNTPEDKRTGWETWQTLEFPNEEKNDESVIAQETAELTYQNDTNKFILKSLYQTQNQSAAAPVQLISALGHIYVFRQSKSYTLLVDRFVLDGMTNKLNRKLEVRFKRSKQKHTPTKNMNKGANGLENVDTLDFRDANGNFFYEPTTELCIVNNLDKGWFSVVLVPTIENDVYRWHIFAYNKSTEKVELTTIRASAEGLFNVKDYTVFDEVNDTLVPRHIPGVIKRTLDIRGVTVNNDVTVINGLAATKYDLQQEQQTQSGEMQLIRTATRLMLAVLTNQGTAALSFAIAGDGTLAQIDETPDSTIIRSKQREVLLPLNTLDEITAFGDSTPPPQGMITGLKVGTDEEDAEDLVKISTDGNLEKLENGDVVKISHTKDYHGLYSTKRVDDNTFEIDLPVVESSVTNMPVGTLLFDGMIATYEKTNDSRLKVTYKNHGLDNGDTVQRAGSSTGTTIYPVQKIDDAQFFIERWLVNAEANVKLISQKLRGIVFDGADDYISLPSLDYDVLDTEFTIEAWVSYDSFQDYSNIIQFMAGENFLAFGIVPVTNKLTLLTLFGGPLIEFEAVEDINPSPGEWIHIAATFRNRNLGDGSLDASLYKNGSLLTKKERLRDDISDILNMPTNCIGKKDLDGNTFFRGKISDVRIWNNIRNESTITKEMHLRLTGQERNLLSYWPLDAITEGKVIDLVSGKNGTVHGGAFVSAATPARKQTLGSWEKQEQEAGGLIFDGMITAYEKTADGKLKVTCPNHGLQDGEQVQIAGTEAYNETYPVQKIDDTHFVIERKWATGEAVNVKLLSQKRRGIVFDGNDDYIEIPDDVLKAPSANEDFEATCSAWIYESEVASGKRFILGQNSCSMELLINQSGQVVFRVVTGNFLQKVEDSNPIAQGQWVHYAGVVDYNKKTQETTLMLCKNGVEVVKQVFQHNVIVLPVLEETQKLQATDKEAFDKFGGSVAISGDTAIVGAYQEDTGGNDAGSAYIFQRKAGRWDEVAKLQASDKETEDFFGYSVAISGDTAIVGAYQEDTGASNAGSAYIFQRKAGRWDEVAKLQSSDKEIEGNFGNSVTISGDTAIVGAYRKSSTDWQREGSVYIFQRNAQDGWDEVAKLQASDKVRGGHFGYSVAISGDTAIVGAIATEYLTGSAYIFQRNAQGRWHEVEKLQASDKEIEDNFGNSVAISGDTAIVGAYLEDTGANAAGSAYIFQRNAQGRWQQVAKLQASDKEPADFFGYSVAISGDTAIVGAYNEDTGGNNAGSAYIFQRNAQGRWQQVEKLQASDKEPNDFFGNSVAISGDTAIVGAYNEDTGGNDAGSAYVFTFQKVSQSRIGKSFVGKIADVQIWNKARTAQEIKDNLYLQLTGKEVGLVGYWRLGAISDGKVIDFSVNGNNGTVFGEPYVSAATLNRKLAGGTDAVQYSNPELFAVSERATYEESFEFKVIHSSKAVDVDYLNNANGQGKIFALSYWGKTSRSAEEKKNIVAVQNEFTEVTNGWYRASCNVTIPERVSLLRSFEIANIKGNWASLEIRKHRIRLLSESITEAKYTDTMTLNSLVNNHASLERKLEELELEELRELGLLKEQRQLELNIATLKLAGDAKTKAIAAKEEQIKNQNKTIKTLEGQLERATQTWQREQDNVLNYWCKLVCRVNENFIARIYTESKALLYADVGANGNPYYNNNYFKFVATDGGYYQIISQFENIGLVGYSQSEVYADPNFDTKNRNDSQWKPEKHSNSDYYLICHRSTGQVLDCRSIKNNFNVWIQNQNQAYYSQQWKIIQIGNESNNNISDAKAFVNTKTQELTLAQNQLIQFQDDLNLLTLSSTDQSAKIRELEERLLLVYQQIIDIQLLINTYNDEFLTGVINTQQNPQSMGQVAKDSKGLVTQGALLGFVNSASRLNAIETSEGNVQLSYFDLKRRMRQTKYDATADGNNAAFEQWIPDAQRACLNFRNDNSVLRLNQDPNNILVLPADWTIEAWFVYPLPEKSGENTLIGRQNAGKYIVVKNGKQLGSYFEQQLLGESFYDSGFNMEFLSEGWHHLTAVGRGDTTLFYIDGKKVGDTKAKALAVAEQQLSAISDQASQAYKDAKKRVDDIKQAILKLSGNIDFIGNQGESAQQFGKLAEVRIWGVALSDEEIAVNSKTLLSGNEPGLLAYYPMNEATGVEVRDHSGNGYNGTMSGEIWWGCSAPIGKVESNFEISDALVSNEYSSVTIENNRKVAIMRRFFAYPTIDGVTLLPDKRVEALELKWIGNAQFAPTLLGYIEGAPPVPSENLTLSDDYNSATSVELTMSEDVAFSWKRVQDSGLGADTETFVGGDTEINAGLGITTKLAALRAGFKGKFKFNYQFQNESSIGSSSSLNMTDKLELRGTSEETAKFPHLGTRFIPKNVGYALVISALADVFVTRLSRSGKMVGYQVQPVDGIPPDVNTITFLINPAYTMNGSLDGLTGSIATSDRFFKHVPEMRSQYGSLYPASYYRLQEAYDLKQQIEEEDKRRESYFSNYDVGTVDELSLARNIDSGDAPTTIGVLPEGEKPESEMTEEEKKKAEEAKRKKAEADAAAVLDNNSPAVKQKQAEIRSKIDDEEKRAQATDSFAGWQKRMESLQIRSGKRNIVNTYVWDADGGLRTEAQSFANTVEHTIGGSFTMDAGYGAEGKFVAGAAVELTALATVNLTQTMSKTENRSKGFQLNVDLGGLEHKGITDYDDKPILPGEKVDRYRFMSFYLEGSTQNFHDFFNYVVDPEWLASNDEEARALRETQAGKPNKAWRVLHRVTYVERPALMGFGRDVRKLRVAAAISENQQLLDKIANLEKKNQKLEEKLDTILDLLKAQK